MKNCDSCHLCCKILEIPGLKDYGKWCPHADPKNPVSGCTIYDRRPLACQDFFCLWKTHYGMGNDLRPDRCGIIFEFFEDEKFILAMVDDNKANNWKKGGPGKFIVHIMKRKGYFFWIMAGKERHLLLPPGQHKISKQEALMRTERAYRRKMEGIK